MHILKDNRKSSPASASPEKGGRKDDLKFNNKFGHYLIGHNKFWHGGVHLEGLYNPIQNIADGKMYYTEIG